MEDDTLNVEEKVFNVSVEESKTKKEPKKGISVTRALVMLGFDDWKDLEPGMYEIVIDELEIPELKNYIIGYGISLR